MAVAAKDHILGLAITGEYPLSTSTFPIGELVSPEDEDDSEASLIKASNALHDSKSWESPSEEDVVDGVKAEVPVKTFACSGDTWYRLPYCDTGGAINESGPIRDGEWWGRNGADEPDGTGEKGSCKHEPGNSLMTVPGYALCNPNDVKRDPKGLEDI